jgi:hypothetical protein
VPVNETGQHFLAGAALAGDQHRGIGLGHPRRQRQQVAGARVVGDDALLLLRPRHSGHVLDQHPRLEGLEQEVAGPGVHRRHRLVHVAEGRHQQHRQVREARADRLQQRDAVHRLHAQIAYHQVEGLALEQAQGGRAVGGADHCDGRRTPASGRGRREAAGHPRRPEGSVAQA